MLVQLEQWLEWNREYPCLPYIAGAPLDEPRIASWEAFWAEAGEAAIVLESGKAGRYTFAAPEPAEWIAGDAAGAIRVVPGAAKRGETGADAERTGNGIGAERLGGVSAADAERAGRAAERLDGPPLEVLRRWMARYRAPRVEGMPKFVGGVAGYLSYDVVRTIERLPSTAAADSPVPEYFFLRMDKLWIVDHSDRMLYCVVHAVNDSGAPWRPETVRAKYAEAAEEAARMQAQWDRWAKASADPSLRVGDDADSRDIDIEAMERLTLNMPKAQYERAVEAVREYIAQGDVFQVNLSVRQSKPLYAPPERVYEALRALNPSPYMAMVKLPGGQRIVSGSPELLVRLEGDRLSTRPIAGTRPRGADEGEDGSYRTELLLSEKERAEHIMLVDLERNDLGKISKYGTVKVNELMAVEHYSHVMHIVSEVEGELAPGKDAFDCIAAVFPGGTITGAPKVRTMEIIEELEPTRRGAYTGAIGWIDYNGNMELNITIRTLVYADGVAHVQSGAGIVIDSVPEKEFRESLSKAKALWKAVEISERARNGREAEPSGAEPRRRSDSL